jgi:hypothetical protein
MITKLSNLGLRISRVQSNQANDYIAIDILDEDSRVTLVELHMCFSTFAQCITGLYGSGLTGETMVEDPRLGLKRRMTSYTVAVPDLGSDRAKYVEWFNNWKLSQPPAEYQILSNSQGFIQGAGDNTTLKYFIVTYEPLET